MNNYKLIIQYDGTNYAGWQIQENSVTIQEKISEAIKIILEIGEPLVGKLLLFDALKMAFRTLKIKKNPDCLVCGSNPTESTTISTGISRNLPINVSSQRTSSGPS